jgi:hypothetical protein
VPPIQLPPTLERWTAWAIAVAIAVIQIARSAVGEPPDPLLLGLVVTLLGYGALFGRKDDNGNG